MYKIKKETGKKLMAAFDECQRRLEKLGFLPMQDSLWLIQHPDTSGKYAGYYKHSKNTEKLPHELAIKPEFAMESDLHYIICHEFGHYVHANLLTQPKINATWIRLFNTSIKVKTFKKDETTALVDAMLSGEERPSDFKSNLDEDQRLAWNWVLRTIKQDHGLSIYELDTLFQAEEHDEIRRVWPSRTLHQKDLAPVISEYATVNHKETFAEAFSFHLIKRKLPSKVTELVEKSIRMACTQQERT
jgi:hypothetical protein